MHKEEDKLKAQIEQMIKMKLLDGFSSDGDKQMCLAFPGGVDFEVLVDEDISGNEYLAVKIDFPVDN